MELKIERIWKDRREICITSPTDPVPQLSTPHVRTMKQLTYFAALNDKRGLRTRKYSTLGARFKNIEGRNLWTKLICELQHFEIACRTFERQ